MEESPIMGTPPLVQVLDNPCAQDIKPGISYQEGSLVGSIADSEIQKVDGLTNIHNNGDVRAIRVAIAPNSSGTQDLTEIKPVTVEQRGTERRRNGAPGGGSVSGAGDVVMDDPPPRDEGPVASLTAEVTIEELLDLLLGLVLADLDGGVAEQRGVELRRRRRGRVDQEDARLELDGEEGAAKHGA
ncbi:hypothetical protein Ahy_B03g068650 isoform H [Arachis hypogaea]|uniref:Uncharacterized protein n=1 Tax=Arachis hypogaea TaxID=3818 RepID=A0A445AAP8_ARAHY|nr:hypothetical protein Ahy_B03g068650 isoform H [Arachis hypogaea]